MSANTRVQNLISFLIFQFICPNLCDHDTQSTYPIPWRVEEQGRRSQWVLWGSVTSLENESGLCTCKDPREVQCLSLNRNCEFISSYHWWFVVLRHHYGHVVDIVLSWLKNHMGIYYRTRFSDAAQDKVPHLFT